MFSGSVEVICGSMFSGKTEELLRRIKRARIGRLKVQVFKPALDTRYSVDHVQSHDSTRVSSTPVKSSSDILDRVDDNTRVVGIDEAQFFDEGIVEVVQKLAYRGIRVICAGLDMDSRGLPFGPMPRLLSVAEQVSKLTAVCMVCGGNATRSQKLIQKEPADGNILLGGKESYEPRCRFCHDPEEVAVTFSNVGGNDVRSS